MAQLVLIKTATPQAEVGDIVEIRVNNYILTGTPGYASFTVIHVLQSRAEVMTILNNKRPEVRRYEKSGVTEAKNGVGAWVEFTEKKYRSNVNLTADATTRAEFTTNATSTVLR